MQRLNPATARVNAKEREEERRVRRAKEEKKGFEAPNVKLLTPTPVTDALIGQEEQNQKPKKKKKQGARP